MHVRVPNSALLCLPIFGSPKSGFSRPCVCHFWAIDRLGQVTGISLAVTNVEIRNGFATDDGAFVQLSHGADLRLSHVILHSMHAEGFAGGAIAGNSSTGVLSTVSFVNCSHGNAAGAFYMQDSESFRFEDISFINCSSNVDYPTFYSRSLTNAESSIVFAGDIYFSGSNRVNPYGSTSIFGFYTHPDSGANISITSDASKPSRFIFEDNPGTMIALNAEETSSINFEIGELHASNALTTLPSSAAILVQASTTLSSHIVVLGTFNVSDFGCLNTNGLVLVDIVGNLNCSTIQTVSSSIFANGSLTLTAGSILLAGGSGGVSLGYSGSPPSSATLSSNYHFKTSGDFHIVNSRSSRVPGAFVANSGEILVEVSGEFRISNVAALVGALTVKWAHMTVLANTIFIGDSSSSTLSNAASAVYVVTGANLPFISKLSLNATQSIIFSDNHAPQGYGGAVRLAPNSNFTMKAPTIEFSRNSAKYGGAFYIAPSQLATFKAARYLSNYANQGCIVSFGPTDSSCPSFLPSYAKSNSLQIDASVPRLSNCSSIDRWCDGTTPHRLRPPTMKQPSSAVLGIVLGSIFGTIFVFTIVSALCCKRKGGNMDCS